MTKAVFCLAETTNQANRIVEHLLAFGFTNEDISVLSPDRVEHKIKHGDVEFSTDKHVVGGGLSTEKHTKAPEGGVTGATAGGLLGGALGLLAGIGALAIPGAGAFIAAGPILAALSGSAVGGGVGLIVGALIGAGIPEFEAKKYETGLKAGNILISVHASDSEKVKRAEDIMRKDNAKDISTSRDKVKH